ncbi:MULTISPECIES: translocation/assembly module TamB domain-containing protein [unclassified Aureimonas]|uniref:translocation/assembly module TamB domain-containing protein n=1 Tax=unclassified Aureimonas TaxID=2615206 RepID=UPI0006FDAFAB|nr:MULTISPECIES: translocation/assembly module TamB domain-containing protein [unclassified Aureimonas]KQT69719.1 hypothetical protein ASG62_00910 [Aureimonas sp. Leaf427]KQT76129.1 hypothetical protein ASG54_15310 [Aureimonas sp. Leaf460]
MTRHAFLAALRVAALGLALLAPATGAKAQAFIAGQIENLLSTNTTKVEIEGLTGALSGAVRIDRVTVSDPKGVFLTASDLAMDWSPLSLARLNVSIEALTAGQIVLERLPEAAPADPNEPAGSGFSLPSITADIRKISLGEFVIGEAIAGTRARLSAEARLGLSKDPARLDVSADIQRLDQPGTIAANLLFAPGENRLDVNIDASEPAGGLVASLLKIPGAPAVNLTVKGQGPLSDFMANGALTVGSDTAATLTAQVTDTGEGRRIAASLGVSAEKYVPTTYAAYVDGGVDLDAQLLIRPDGTIAIDQASLVSGRIDAQASGTYDPAGAGNALNLAVSGRGGGTVPIRLGAEGARTAIDIASLKATLKGALSAAAIEASATLPTAGYGPYVATDLALAAASPAFDVNALAGPLTITADAASLTAPEGIQDRFLEGAIRIEAEGALSGSGLSLTTGRVTTGVANAGITGSAAFNFSTFDLKLTSDFETLALSAAAVPLAGDRLNVSGAVTRGADGTLTARDLAVRGTGLAIDGGATLTNETVTADVTGRIDAADAENASISGKAEFKLTANGPVAAPDVDVSLTSQGLRVNGRELANLKLEARGAFTSATPSGTVDLSGTLDGVPLTGTALVETLANGERRVSNLTIVQGPNRISGELRFTEAPAPLGRLDFAVADIGPLAALALQQMQGDLNGTVALSMNEADFPLADVNLTSQRLAVAGTVLQGVAIDLGIADYLGRPFPVGKVTANAFEAGTATVSDLDLDLTRSGDFTRLEATAKANGAPVTFAGQANLAPTETVIGIETLTADIPNAAIALTAPATITLRDGTTEIGKLELKTGDGSLSLVGRSGAALDLDLSLDRVPAAVANPFVQGLDASGTFTGSARVTGASSAPEAVFDLRAEGLATSQTRAANLPALEALLAGTFKENVLALETANLDIGEGSLSASGRVGQSILDLQLALDKLPVALANDFVSGLGASGTISGTATATGTIAEPVAEFTLSGTGITAREIASAGIEPIELDAAGRYATRTLTLDRARATVGPGSLTASGTIGDTLNVEAAMTEVPVGLANAFVPDLRATGTISGTAKATGPLTAPNAVFDLAGSGIGARAIAESGIPPIDLRVAGTAADGSATLQTAVATIGEASLTATGTVGRTLDLDIRADRIPVGLANGFVPNLDARGTISGTAKATGTLAAPNAVFDLSGGGLTARPLAASGLPPADLRLAGRYDQGTATLQTANVQLGEASVTATGTVGQRLDLDIAARDLPVAVANGFVSGLGASGTISGTAKATGSLSNPAATFDIAGRRITTDKLKASGTPAITLDAKGRYADGSAELETARASVGDGSLTASGTVGQRLNVKATLDRLPVALANAFVADLGARGTISGSGTAVGTLADPQATFDLTASDVSTRQTRDAGAPQVDAVARGRYATGTADIETARVDIGRGRITIAGRAGRDLDLDVTIADLPASIAGAAAEGLDPAGSIAGRIRATGPIAAPDVTFDIDGRGLSVAQTRNVGVANLSFDANGRFAANVLTLDANLAGNGLALRANGTVATSGTPQLNLAVNGTAPLAIANAVLAEGGRSVNGTVAIDATVTGAASAPEVNGTIRASGASFVDTGSNVAVNNINATITLAGKTATISAFSANLAAGGTIAVSGTIGLDQGFPADIRIRMNQGRYNDGELIAARLDADLTITGSLIGTPLLAGTIDARQIDILVPDRLPTSLARIDVRHVNTSEAVRKQAREIAPKSSGGGGGGGIALDIRFNAPNQVYVRGRGLDIELGGAIAIAGTASAPAITGALELRRGRFNILANRLDFTRGILTFSGDLVPTLDLVATSDAGDVTVQISVTGPATDPSFNFSSTPALPQDEVLARLIFGQGTADLSPLQIAQLAEAASQLAGVGGSTGLLENLRAQLGVDDVDIKTNADGKTSVGVGKYLNDNTYLGVDSTGRVSIDLDLGAGLKARGAVSASGGGEVGVFYEKEY